MTVWPFIEAEEAEQQHSVKRACELLKVSRSAFYEYRKHTPSPRELSDRELLDKIRKIHDESKGTYGSPRVHGELRNQGGTSARSASLASWSAPGWKAGARSGGARRRSRIPTPNALAI